MYNRNYEGMEPRRTIVPCDEPAPNYCQYTKHLDYDYDMAMINHCYDSDDEDYSDYSNYDLPKFDW